MYVYSSVSTAVSFAILASVIGVSFAYVSAYPRLGLLQAISITPEDAQQLHLDKPYGLLVIVVSPGSPADNAGIRESTIVERNGEQVLTNLGDIIIGADGKPIKSAEDLYSLLNKKHVDDAIRLTIIRDNRTEDVEVFLK